MHIYDYIIIGSGLTGLTIANRLQQETDNILVLEATEQSGGQNRPAQINQIKINNGLRFLPSTEVAHKSLQFLSGLLGEDVQATVVENNPETYEASGFKKFVGFGNTQVAFYDELAYYLSSEELVLEQPMHSWVQKLTDKLASNILTKHIVTKIVFEDLSAKNPAVSHVIVNGNKNLFAKNFIFAAPIKDLELLLPDEILNIRAKSKLKKSLCWQSVCVDLFHTHVVDKTNVFVLNGTTDDDIGPCLGRFVETLPDGQGQISQWTSFIDSELSEETENIGLVLKKIKRQIKRAFPEVGDSIKTERIFVSPPLSGAELKVSASATLPHVPNMWIASPHLSKSKNILASLQQAQFILASLGFLAEAPVENTSTETEEVSEASAE